MKRILASFAGAALLAAPSLAGAQLAPGGGPIAYSADEQEYLDGERVLHWRGRVELLQEPNRLRADQMKLFFAPRNPGARNTEFGSNVGQLERIEAEGNVYFVTPTETVRGDRAVYTAADDTIVVTGEVIVTRGPNVMTGSRLTVQVEAGRSTMDGVQTPAGRRVRGVFYPESR